MKNYLIIGGTSGIGKALVGILQKKEGNIYATYHNSTPQAEYPTVSYHMLDILSDTLDFSYLPDTIDGVVYCPGSVNLVPFARIKPEDFINDYQLQVVGAIKVLQAILTKLKAAKNASIVLFSTIATQTGFTFHSQVAASKGAINGITRSLAAELAPTIRVNAIAPSITDTPLVAKLLSSDEKKSANAQRHPLKKIGTPTDIAEMAAFLLSEKSSWITGQILSVDGGISSIKL